VSEGVTFHTFQLQIGLSKTGYTGDNPKLFLKLFHKYPQYIPLVLKLWFLGILPREKWNFVEDMGDLMNESWCFKQIQGGAPQVIS